MKITLNAIIISLVLFACDRIETNYKNYAAANENGYFEKGWIPNRLVYKSMTNIYVQNDLDINIAFFAFNLSQQDLNNLETKIHLTKRKFQNPHRLRVKKDWIDKINQSPIHYLLSEQDTIYLALDKNNNQVFGWNDKKE